MYDEAYFVATNAYAFPPKFINRPVTSKPLGSLARRMLFTAALILAAVNVHRLAETVGRYTLMNDFWKAYFAAGYALIHDGRAGLSPLIGGLNFVNWPAVSFLFVPLAALGHDWAGYVYLTMGLGVTALSVIILAKGQPLAHKIAVCLLFLANGPLWYNIFNMGNSTQYILLALIGSLSLVRREKMWAAGVLIGAAAAIKPMITIFVVYYIVRRNWRLSLAAIGVLAGTALLSVAAFGLETTRFWYMSCISDTSTLAIGAYNNQSLFAFLLRLSTGTQFIYDYHGHAVGNLLLAVYKIIGTALLLLIGWSLWFRRSRPISEHHQERLNTLDYGALIGYCIVTSPVSWTHYYLLLLFPWSLYITGRFGVKCDVVTKSLIWSSILMCSLPVQVLKLPSNLLSAVSIRTIASVWMFGGLAFLVACIRSAIQDGCVSRVAPWRRELSYQ
jgi:hypothetical protein